MGNRLSQLAKEYSHRGTGREPTREEIQNAINVGTGRVPNDIAYSEKPLGGGFDIGEVGGIPINATDFIPADLGTNALTKLALLGKSALGVGLAGTAKNVGKKLSQIVSEDTVRTIPKTEYEIAHEIERQNSSAPVDSLFDTIGLPNRGRELIQSKAEEYAKKMRDAGVDVAEIIHSGSAAGPSSYIRVIGQPDIRVSGHSKGVFNSGDVINIGNDEAFNNLLERLPKTVRKATPEDYARLKQEEIDTMYPLRIKNAQKKILKGKELTISEKEAMDWFNGQRSNGNILAGMAAGAIGLPLLYGSNNNGD